MTVFLLPREPVFPPPEEAEADGLIAMGGDLTSARLLNSYSSGIFPWFDDGQTIFWYSPDPRMVIFPEQFKLPRSLGRIIRKGNFEIRYDTVFDEVITSCAMMVRPDQDGTWISENFIRAYGALYDQGYAHSVEVFLDNTLAGGLYGISLGTAFFGESMFHTVKDASKVALHALVEKCKFWKFRFIDCQVETEHLRALGAVNIPRTEYLSLLKESLKYPTRKGRW